eukprot:TRINITY_DN42586_c0_g1_i1.p1 TRINITY_DN42586_c0_g1~~TRINITY_DN42586_c0_g1_i1.p1  ORF type:complete len:516 (+),score=27.02 TRINITY_DN42586_c0_g1_i1:21-1568(+)
MPPHDSVQIQTDLDGYIQLREGTQTMAGYEFAVVRAGLGYQITLCDASPSEFPTIISTQPIERFPFKFTADRRAFNTHASTHLILGKETDDCISSHSSTLSTELTDETQTDAPERHLSIYERACYPLSKYFDQHRLEAAFEAGFTLPESAAESDVVRTYAEFESQRVELDWGNLTLLLCSMGMKPYLYRTLKHQIPLCSQEMLLLRDSVEDIVVSMCEWFLPLAGNPNPIYPWEGAPSGSIKMQGRFGVERTWTNQIHPTPQAFVEAERASQNPSDKVTLYHATNGVACHAILYGARWNETVRGSDFGGGVYLHDKPEGAVAWALKNKHPTIIEFTLTKEKWDASRFTFTGDVAWRSFVAANRMGKGGVAVFPQSLDHLGLDQYHIISGKLAAQRNKNQPWTPDNITWWNSALTGHPIHQHCVYNIEMLDEIVKSGEFRVHILQGAKPDAPCCWFLRGNCRMKTCAQPHVHNDALGCSNGPACTHHGDKTDWIAREPVKHSKTGSGGFAEGSLQP